MANSNPDSDNIDDDSSTSTGHHDNNASGREVTQLNLTHVEVAFLLPNITNVADTNQIIEDLGAESDDSLIDFLANALNDFCDLNEEIPTEDVLNENDIIKLI
ncbi:hypothetical protein RCL_jg16641.t1 [Rhizophagus clarus]|uniref:Uncharacterized protein n=1 Tax=Rhizophagus clarus TaxID=94130 RepID=A0A8H3LI04_9GLOM|nr:hypothetical protein RCL_jg16641.t1 [Rhizophagus clarus]